MTESDGIRLRVATPDDAAALLAVYAPYVTDTAISFEYDVPTVEEFQRRILHILKRYPYLAAERDGHILGYAYAGSFIGRPAYGWSAEVTIYLDMNCRRLGLGRRLYAALEGICQAQGILNLNACICLPETDDQYVTRNSVDFHAHMGYRMVGGFRSSGYKFGRWYDMVWMEKLIGTREVPAKAIIPFPALPPEVVQIFLV